MWRNTSAHVVKWMTENNRPINIITDRELIDLLSAGRPNIILSSVGSVYLHFLQYVFSHTFVTPLASTNLSRNTLARFTLQPMRGRLQTTAHLLHGQCTWSLRERRLPFCWILLRLLIPTLALPWQRVYRICLSRLGSLRR